MSIQLTSNFYTGNLLVANPNNPRDELSKSVTLLISHNKRMALGLQINNSISHMTLNQVAENTGLDTNHPASRLDVPLYYGGVHGVHRVQVVHTSDWQGPTTITLSKDISVTNDISVLQALSRGKGPRLFRACAGFWTWEDGKLDCQLDNHNREESHRWEIAPASTETVFESDGDEQWQRSLINAAHYTTAQWL
jgi:putative transcriptional regulator